MTALPGRRPVSVLVVDDVPDAAESLAILLRLHGFAARTAPDGSSALRAAAADPPDAVVTDLGMPDLGGWELARRLRAQCPTPPFVVAVTGYDRDVDRRRSAEAGIDLHLIKPVEPDELVAALKQVRPAAATPRQAG